MTSNDKPQYHHQLQLNPIIRAFLRFTNEPGVLRANLANYDCVEQVYIRISQYLRMGHVPDKLEVLVLGGTFSEYPKFYYLVKC